MKKFLMLCLVHTFVLCSYGSSKDYSLSKSIWYSAENAELTDNQEILVTSLHFVSSSEVDVYVSVLGKNGCTVTPFLYAKGTYETSGDPKREAEVSITGRTIDGEKYVYRGKYRKEDGMLLSSEDAHIMTFVKMKKEKLP